MTTDAQTTTRGRRAEGAGVPTAPQDHDGSLTHRQILTILTGLMMGMFLAALDQTIVATAIRTIGDDLNGLSVQAWVTTAYLITSTIATPLYGKLSDIYGRKPYFLAAISIFTIGSLLCTFSTSMYMLAGFRAIQGVGAGGLFSLALAIIGDIVSPRERAKYQGYFLAVFGTSSVLGPVIGGFFAGADSIFGITGWRWVFLVNVPIAVAALFVVNHTLNIEHHRRDHRIDWWGATALVVGLVPLLTVAEQGRTWGWGSGLSLTCFAVGLVGVIGFFLAERMMGDEALIPLRLFKDRSVSVSTATNVIVGMGMFGGIVSIPLYLQIVKGATPTESGLQLLPLTLGIMIASIISGQLISRTGRYKVFPIIGTSLMLVGLLLFSRVGADTPLWHTMLVMFVFGYGLGNSLQPLVLAIQNAVPPRDIGVATSSATFFRQIGGTLGVAIFLSILFGSVPSKLSAAFARIAPTQDFQAALHDPANAAFAKSFSSGGIGGNFLNDSSFLGRLDPRLAEPFRVGFSDSMSLVFLCAAIVIAVGLVVVCFLPQVELRQQSGLQAAASERAEAAAAAVAAADQAGTAGAMAGVSDGGEASEGKAAAAAGVSDGSEASEGKAAAAVQAAPAAAGPAEPAAAGPAAGRHEADAPVITEPTDYQGKHEA